jgi:hypothetical protein
MSELVADVALEVFKKSEAQRDPSEKLKGRAEESGDDVADIDALCDRRVG